MSGVGEELNTVCSEGPMFDSRPGDQICQQGFHAFPRPLQFVIRHHSAIHLKLTLAAASRYESLKIRFGKCDFGLYVFRVSRRRLFRWYLPFRLDHTGLHYLSPCLGSEWPLSVQPVSPFLLHISFRI
jgi:hypothetical protein